MQGGSRGAWQSCVVVGCVWWVDEESRWRGGNDALREGVWWRTLGAQWPGSQWMGLAGRLCLWIWGDRCPWLEIGPRGWVCQGMGGTWWYLRWVPCARHGPSAGRQCSATGGGGYGVREAMCRGEQRNGDGDCECRVQGKICAVRFARPSSYIQVGVVDVAIGW